MADAAHALPAGRVFAGKQAIDDGFFSAFNRCAEDNRSRFDLHAESDIAEYDHPAGLAWGMRLAVDTPTTISPLPEPKCVPVRAKTCARHAGKCV